MKNLNNITAGKRAFSKISQQEYNKLDANQKFAYDQAKSEFELENIEEKDFLVDVSNSHRITAEVKQDNDLDEHQQFWVDQEKSENEGHNEQLTEQELLARMDPSVHFQYKVKKELRGSKAPTFK